MATALFLNGELAAQSYGYLYSIRGDTSAAALGAKFGWSMSSSAELLVIGSPHFDAQYGRVSALSIGTFDPPQVLAEVRDNQVNLSGDNPIQQRFGASVSLDGDWLMVGNCSPFGTTQYCNSAADRVLVFQHTGDTMQAYQSINCPDWISGGSFGKAIAVEGDVLAIGGTRTGSGATTQDVVYIYRLVASLWQLTDSLFGDGNAGGNEEAFGHALAMRDGRLIVGASGDDELATDCGAAYLFDRNQDGIDNWGLVRKLLPSQIGAGDRFGTSVALNSDRCVVGAPKRITGGHAAGAAYVFERDAGFQGNWGETAYLEPIGGSEESMDYGASVALGPERIAVGAPLHNLSPQGTDGSVHVYRNDVNGWTAMQRIVPHEDQVISTVGRAGTALAFHGERLLIGAPFAIINGLTPPATYPTGVVLVYEEGVVSVTEHAAYETRLWPNPFTDQVHFSCIDCAKGTARVLDAQGRSVRVLGTIATGTNNWDLAELEAGPYYIQADLPDGERITVLVIRK